jgi:hypothetical protein
MINHIIETLISMLAITLGFIGAASFIFMFFVAFNGYILASVFLFVVSVLSISCFSWLIENEWRFRR